MRMFVGRAEQTAGVYQTKHHPEEMVALFSTFSSHLLAQGDPNFVRRCFDEQDELRDPIPRSAAFLENRIENLDGDGKDEFVRFLKAMMKIGPGGDRKAANQLLDESWVGYASTSNSYISLASVVLVDFVIPIRQILPTSVFQSKDRDDRYGEVWLLLN